MMSNNTNEVHAHDVLFGRGKGIYLHEGNVVYRNLIRTYKKQYLSCQKGDKKKISRCIVNAIKSQEPPGRFLELDSQSGCWKVVVDDRCIDKTCQVLRDERVGTDHEIPSIKSIKSLKGRYRSNYLNKMSKVSMLYSENSDALGLSLNKYPNDKINKLECDRQKESSDSKCQEPSAKRKRQSFSSYDNIILANLQKFYSNKRECIESPCQDNIHNFPSNDRDGNFISVVNNSDSYRSKEHDVVDDIFTFFTDFDQDFTIASLDDIIN